MSDRKPPTLDVHGRFWGARARDWADYQEGHIAPAYHATFDRLGVGPGTRYLDVGCGAGLAAAMAAQRGATVAGIDAAEAMLDVARGRVQGDFRHGDLEELPFADASFDAVTGFNAFQFAANPAVALAEARRVLGPGGKVAILTWGMPEAMPMARIVGALRGLLPPPPPGAPGPFALSEESALRGFAAAAGLVPEAVFDTPCAFVYPDLGTALRGVNASGVAARAIDLAGEEAVTSAHRAAIEPFVQADGGVRIEASFRCLVARA